MLHRAIPSMSLAMMLICSLFLALRNQAAN